MRILFFGITQFGTSGLIKLIERGTPPVGLVVAPFLTQDVDNMRRLASDHQIPVFAPVSPNTPEMLAAFRTLQPDILISYTYDKKLSPELLSIPRFAFNMHPSLLPDYRGNNPYFWTIANGETETGVTFHRLTDRFDEGDILLQERLPISPFDTCGTIVRAQEPIAATLLHQLLSIVESGKPLPRTPQSGGAHKIAPKPTLRDQYIDWSWPTQKIIDRVRALNPYSGAFTHYKKNTLFIYQASPTATDHNEAAVGTIIALSSKGPVVKTGDGAAVLNVILVDRQYLRTGPDFIEYEHVQIGDTLTGWI